MVKKFSFNDKAHSIITDLLDTTEDWLVRHEGCEPQLANDRIAYDYIMQCSGIIWGSTSFITADERIGTDIFISQLRGASSKLRSTRTRMACVTQLMQFPLIYFRNYLTVLRITFLRELPKLITRDLVMFSGIVKLAAANLPGVRSDIRRELRRRGENADALIVPDDTLERQLGRFKPELFTIEG